MSDVGKKEPKNLFRDGTGICAEFIRNSARSDRLPRMSLLNQPDFTVWFSPQPGSVPP